MARTVSTTLLVAVAATMALLAIAGTSAAAPTAEAATASSCSVSISSATRTVRRGGKVLLEGETCRAGTSSAASGNVRVKIKKKKRWATVAKTEVDPSGQFTVCARVSVPRNTKVARLRATAEGGSGTTTVRIGKKGPSGCGNPGCPLSSGGSSLTQVLPSACKVVASDTSSNPNPIPFWGGISCVSASRHQQVTSGGDKRPAATGASQGNSAYRRMTAFDGDDYWGERCELGYNDWSGPVAFYHEGQRRATYASFRLPANYPADTDKWQGVLQMKQSAGSDNQIGTPVLSLSAYEGHWSLWHSEPGYTDEDFKLWEGPAAQNGVWTRFAIDAFYSQDPNKGWVKIYIDANADGDFNDSGEQSPTYRTNTLKYEIGTDNSDGMPAGQSIPSHLRIGMYHHPGVPCPTPSGCSVEADNIQVVKA